MLSLNDKAMDDVLNILDVGLIILDSARRVIGWNAWLTGASRIPAEQVIGRRLDEIFPVLELRRLNSALNEAFEFGTASFLTHSLNPRLFPLKTRAGKDMAHNVSVRALGPDSAGACLIQIIDVSAAAYRERVLRERQNARYDAVVGSAPDAILTLDIDGLIQLANPAAALEFGYGPQELVGQPVGVLIHDQPCWEKTWQALLRGEVQQRPIEVTARRKDGTPSHLEVSASSWLSESRLFITAILRDVNERHAAEAALRRLNETLEERVATALAERRLFAAIVESSDAFIQVLDLDHRILAVNNSSADEFERRFGTRPQVGDSLLDLLAHHPLEQAEAKALWGRALAGEAFTIVQEVGDAAQDGRYYELKFNALRNAQGVQIASFQFVYDVTERIRHDAHLAATEAALRQAQKMEAIGQLTGGIAHDFNNLLTGIIGAMEVLKRRIAAGKYDDTQRFMDAAVTSGNRAAALTHRLLAFARRQPLDPKDLDANQLIRGMEDLFRRTLGEQIRLTVDLDPALWPTLTDANQLENAILNLVINARDAMPDGGSLTISTRNVVRGLEMQQAEKEIEPGDYTIICVGDTGVGMPPEVIKKVFDPFFTTKPIGEGTGLGLSMIYGFVKQSRGHVFIDSVVGEGTQVSLYLPRYKGGSTADQAEEGIEIPAGSGETVLLVDDDSSVRLLIGEVLRELGYNCIEAVDAQAALPILTSGARVDLMITDVGLPGMNGRKLAEIARQHRPHLKILFVTGYAEHATGEKRFLDRGMEMATKPFSLDVLALRIRNILSARR